VEKPDGQLPPFGTATGVSSALARQYAPDVLYPLGHEPTFTTANRAPPEGAQ
jgi:hypothetical protein